MITSGFTYLATILFIAGIIVLLDKTYQNLFKHLPGVVLLYFIVMLCTTFGLWQQSPDVKLYYKMVKDAAIPCMIFLMLLRCDLRKIAKLGPKMLIGFFSATLTICTGFIVTYGLLKNQFEPEFWKPLSTLCGSWIGGTGNMAAVQGALQVPDAKMGNVLLMDSVCYGIWVMFLLAIVPYARYFNKWTHADTRLIDEVGAKLKQEQLSATGQVDFSSLFLLLGTSLFVSAACQNLAASEYIPKTQFLSTSTWAILFVTLAGTLCALTKMGQIPGASPLSNIMLYTIIGLYGSQANFRELTQAPFYIAAGFMIMAIHAGLMVALARIFKLDLFTCGVASLANIGGAASAPILAAAYSEVLIPIGVLMALLGYLVGTQGGLIVGKILSMI
ncbi:MAG: DUF819 family protein [Candidatus Wallbacteria bacterium]|nr:DUF819 family protein [Candidatus Wallbacteria bacterium]